MLRIPPLLLALAVCSAPAWAQDASDGACARPDTIAIHGNSRVSESTIRTDAGLGARDTLNFRSAQRAIKALYGTGQFSDIQLLCDVGTPGHATLVLQVRERPLLRDFSVTGPDIISGRTVRERVDVGAGRPLDPAAVAQSIARIDSLYESEGYFLTRVRAESTFVEGQVRLTFVVEEGSRLAVSGIDVTGAKRVPAKDIVKSMNTKPEGFWWWRKGEFDRDKFAGDVGERIPKLYAQRGYVDVQILKDTLIVDRERGKGLIRLDIDEGPRYKVGTFEVAGNRRFSTEEIKQFYPFGQQEVTLRQQITYALRRNRPDPTAFDQSAWDEATQRVRTAYNNEGYIYNRVVPVVERVKGADSLPTVNLRWEIQEGTPAVVNRIEIGGNDYTSSSCIRDALVLLPGEVFNQEALIRSYQNISNLGFFETPLPFPDTKPINDKGDIDVIFKVKEKRTGNINFGASVGQGTGVGGFFGIDQPNFLGNCKRVAVNWSFGRYLNDFSVSYTDPSIRMSRYSGTVTAYHRQSRYTIADLGVSTSTGGSLQFGFPSPWSRYTRFFVSYGGEGVKYQPGAGIVQDTTFQACNGCFRSTLGFGGQHDTRIDLPFATAGNFQRFDAQFNGGPLGGTAAFQRYTGEMRGYAPLFQLGGGGPGGQPIKFVLGLTARTGAVFGNTGPFFYSQQFSLGGTQYGEMLRGYDEFSITPNGYVANTSNTNATRGSFGNAFFSSTAEFGVRFNQMLYVDAFYDAGNIWARARDIDPTRLFRGAGVGVALVTPLGPLGLDWAYGLDRVDAFGRPDPKWQLHFRLGNIF